MLPLLIYKSPNKTGALRLGRRSRNILRIYHRENLFTSHRLYPILGWKLCFFLSTRCFILTWACSTCKNGTCLCIYIGTTLARAILSIVREWISSIQIVWGAISGILPLRFELVKAGLTIGYDVALKHLVRRDVLHISLIKVEAELGLMSWCRGAKPFE